MPSQLSCRISLTEHLLPIYEFKLLRSMQLRTLLLDAFQTLHSQSKISLAQTARLPHLCQRTQRTNSKILSAYLLRTGFLRRYWLRYRRYFYFYSDRYRFFGSARNIEGPLFPRIEGIGSGLPVLQGSTWENDCRQSLGWQSLAISFSGAVNLRSASESRLGQRLSYYGSESQFPGLSLPLESQPLITPKQYQASLRIQFSYRSTSQSSIWIFLPYSPPVVQSLLMPSISMVRGLRLALATEGAGLISGWGYSIFDFWKNLGSCSLIMPISSSILTFMSCCISSTRISLVDSMKMSRSEDCLIWWTISRCMWVDPKYSASQSLVLGCSTSLWSSLRICKRKQGEQSKTSDLQMSPNYFVKAIGCQINSQIILKSAVCARFGFGTECFRELCCVQQSCSDVSSLQTASQSKSLREKISSEDLRLSRQQERPSSMIALDTQEAQFLQQSVFQTIYKKNPSRSFCTVIDRFIYSSLPTTCSVIQWLGSWLRQLLTIPNRRISAAYSCSLTDLKSSFMSCIILWR